MENSSEIIQNFLLFKNISAPRLKHLLRTIKFHSLILEKGTQITLGKAENKYLFFLVQGKLKSELLGEDGKILRIRELISPDMIGIAYLFNSGKQFPFQLTVTESAKLLRISRGSVLSLLQKDSILLENFLSILSDKLLYLMKKIEFLNFNTIRKKAGYYLLNLEYDNSDIIQLPLSIENLANYFGIERPSLSKVLSDFQKEGLIQLQNRGSYKVLDRKSLARILEE